MKFLSNFDTNLEHDVVSKYVKLYGSESVFCIHRAKIFWVMYCLLPWVWIACLLLVYILLYNIDTWDSSLNTIKWLILFCMIVVTVVVWGRKVLRRYFDYKMDFCVVTPQEIAAYNQSGLLTRTSRTIDADKIKTVSVNTSWIRKSIFNYGDLTFLSEWDQSGWWDISLNFVHDVNATKNTVRDLIEPHLQKNTHHHEKS